MTEPISIDRIIWELPTNYTRTKEEFSAIIEHLVNTLSEYLQQQIEIVDKTIEESIVDNESFCCCIRSAASFGGPLSIAWEGRLGMEAIEGKPLVSVSLFLFSHNKRLNIVGQQGSYVDLVYGRHNSGRGGWHFQGWEEDVYGEYEDIDEYSGDLLINA